MTKRGYGLRLLLGVTVIAVVAAVPTGAALAGSPAVATGNTDNLTYIAASGTVAHAPENPVGTAPVVHTGFEPQGSAPSDATMIFYAISPIPAEAGLPETIIGFDDRVQIKKTTKYPASATVMILFEYGNALCTGWLVSPDTVATAGHCVADGGYAYFYDMGGYTMFAGANGNAAPLGSCYATDMYTNSIWYYLGLDSYDYGAIKLNCEVGLWAGWYGFIDTGGLDIRGTTVITQGYPGDKPWGQQWQASKCTGEKGKKCAVKIDDGRRLYYPLDTFGGQSGSPVYNKFGKCKACSVAFHAYGNDGSGFNHGTKIIPEVFDFLIWAINR